MFPDSDLVNLVIVYSQVHILECLWKPSVFASSRFL